MLNLATAYADTDSGSGTKFSDGTFNKVHVIRTGIINAAGASGSGNLSTGGGTTNVKSDYNNAIRLQSVWSSDGITYGVNCADAVAGAG